MLFLKNRTFEGYLALINSCTGVPVKSHHSRNLFSKNRLYGSFTYCGRLAKNTNVGICVFGNWVQYLILIYLPFHAGGG